jgi:hypothetical protein
MNTVKAGGQIIDRRQDTQQKDIQYNDTQPNYH